MRKYGYNNQGYLVLTDGNVYIGFAIGRKANARKYFDAFDEMGRYCAYDDDEIEERGIKDIEWMDAE